MGGGGGGVGGGGVGGGRVGGGCVCDRCGENGDKVGRMCSDSSSLYLRQGHKMFPLPYHTAYIVYHHT